MQCDAAELRSPRTLWLPQSSQPATSRPTIQVEGGTNDSKFLQSFWRGWFCGCDRNAGGFPWKAFPLRSSAPPLNIWMKSCSCIKVPYTSQLAAFPFFFFFLVVVFYKSTITGITLFRFLIAHGIFATSFLWIIQSLLIQCSWGCSLSDFNLYFIWDVSNYENSVSKTKHK